MRQPFQYPGDGPIGRCPLRTFYEEGPEFESKVLTYHMSWKQGILPEPGGLLDQGGAYGDAMAAVEAGFNAAQTMKQEQAKRDQEKKLKQQSPGSGRRRR